MISLPYLGHFAVSAAEDPEKILDQAVEDMQNDLIRMRQAAAEVRFVLSVVSRARESSRL
jgi:phage shock protein A